MTFKISVLFLSLLFVPMTFAKDMKCLTVTAIEKNETRNYDMYLEVKKGEAKTLKLFDRFKKSWLVFKIRNLAKGVVLKKEGRHKVITAYSDDFEKDRGGSFLLKVLKNGFTGAKHILDFDLQFNGKEWVIYSAGSPVDKLKFHVGALGVKDVEVVLSEK